MASSQDEAHVCFSEAGLMKQLMLTFLCSYAYSTGGIKKKHTNSIDQK